MSGSLILVRHARPRVTADRAPGLWALTEDGLDAARRLGLSVRDFLGDTAVTVLCSTEQKAIDTAKALGLGEVDTDERLCELTRPWYEDEPSFRAAVERFLTGSPASGWEPADQAVARFGAALNDLDGTGVVVTHGTVMSAWLGHEVTGLDPVRFWNGLRMPDAWLIDLSAQFATRIGVGTVP